MRDVEHQLQAYWGEITSDLPQPTPEAAWPKRPGDGEVRPIKRRPAARHRPAWAVAAAAFTSVLLLGGVIGLLVRAGSGPREDAASPTASIPVPSASTQAEGSARNPVLSITQAGPAPPAATCPEGADPDVAGLTDQSRPWGATWSNQAAAFDRHAGKVIYLDESGDTWAFDVCTNTWQQMHPRLVPDDPSAWPDPDGWSGALVYDVDSDVTVAFRGYFVSVYDANTNTWTRRPLPDGYETGGPGFGAVYDPISGLIVLQTNQGLVAYDVETHTWAPTGIIEDEGAESTRQPSYLVGYVAETDQLAFVSVSDDSGTLIDPRTGASSSLDLPFPDVFAGFGRLNYATSSRTPILMDDTICRLDPMTLQWVCVDLAHGAGQFGVAAAGSGLLAAIVEDPINSRAILIYGYGPGFDGKRFYDVNDIWAVDFDTAEWTLLLDRTGEMTMEHDD